MILTARLNPLQFNADFALADSHLNASIQDTSAPHTRDVLFWINCSGIDLQIQLDETSLHLRSAVQMYKYP